MFLTARSSTSYDTFALNEMDSFTWKGYSIVDVREPDEYDIGHIPGAINVPLSFCIKGTSLFYIRTQTILLFTIVEMAHKQRLKFYTIKGIVL